MLWVKLGFLMQTPAASEGSSSFIKDYFLFSVTVLNLSDSASLKDEIALPCSFLRRQLPLWLAACSDSDEGEPNPILSHFLTTPPMDFNAVPNIAGNFTWTHCEHEA